MVTNTQRIITMMLADVAISEIATRLSITDEEVVEVVREVLKDLIFAADDATLSGVVKWKLLKLCLLWQLLPVRYIFWSMRFLTEINA